MQFVLGTRLGQTGLPISRVQRDGMHKCCHDRHIHAKPPQAALAASYSDQQCSQHDRNRSVRTSAVCRADHSQMGFGHCTRHQWLVSHIQFGRQEQQQRLWRRHSSDRSRRSRLTEAAAVAARGGQNQGCMMVGRGPVDSMWSNRCSSSGSSSRMYHYRQATLTRPVADLITFAPAIEMRAHTAADIAPAAVAAGLEPADPVSCSSSNTSGSSGNGTSQLSSEAVLDISDPLGELGRYSYRMIISYDGTEYSGWQLQTQASTIQGHIERALSTVLRENRRSLGVSAAGRTDAGVHARGQVVQFFTNSSSIDPDKLPFKLNSLLPHDIRVQWMSPTAPDFNVTVSAIRKTYHYHLDTGRCHDPLRMRYCHHCKKPLDLGAMRAGAELLIGTHDFTQFSNESRERLKRNPVKTLERLDVLQEGSTAVKLEVQGSGFLYKQVRHMTGVLLAVGEGRLDLQDISSRLEVGSTRAPGAGGLWRGYNVAPAKGLQLFVVEYPAAVDDPHSLLYPELPHDEWGRLLAWVPGVSSVDEE